MSKNYLADYVRSGLQPSEIDVFTPLDYRPHAKQKKFHELSKERIAAILFGGAAGGGKSCGMLMDAIYNVVNHPNMKVACIRKSYPELEESFLAELRKRNYCRPLESIFGSRPRYNQTDHILTFPNGSLINFTFASNDIDADRLLGGEYQAFYIDEAGLMPPTVIQHIEERLRSGTRGLPVIGLRLSTNPGGQSHKYLRDRFITPTKYGKEVVQDADDRSVAFIQSKYTDNPYIDKAYERILNSIPDANRRAAMRDGDWDAMVGAFFSTFQRMRHVVPSLIDGQPWVLPKEWPRYCGIDYGIRDPFAAEWGAIDNDGRVWMYREIYATEVDAPNQAKLILEAEKTAGEVDVIRVADPSMWGNRGTPLSIADCYGLEGCGIAQADNDRPNGWARFFFYLAEAPACEYHRAMGWETCPLIHFFEEGCPNLIDSIPNLPRSKTNPDDAETRQVDDHGIDACVRRGTYIATTTGILPIEDVRRGDFVYTRRGPKRVLVAGLTKEDAPVFKVNFDNEGWVSGTQDHPVWVESRGWLPISSLAEHDLLCNISGDAVRVVDVVADGEADVYNLSVEDAEEYFANGVLVHNCRYLLMMAGNNARPVIFNDSPSRSKIRAHEAEVNAAYGIPDQPDEEPLVYGRFAGNLGLKL